MITAVGTDVASRGWPKERTLRDRKRIQRFLASFDNHNQGGIEMSKQGRMVVYDKEMHLDLFGDG